MLLKAIIIISAVALLPHTKCAKILGIFPMAGMSHYILDSKLMKSLSEAGHDVTMVSPYALKDRPKSGNFTDVVLDGFVQAYENNLVHNNLFKSQTLSPMAQLKKLTRLQLHPVNNTLNHPEMKRLVESGQKFDVVIMEQFYNDGLKVYGHLFNCPLIVLNTVGPNFWINPAVGNPQPVSYIPHAYSRDYSNNPSIFQRLYNLYLFTLDYWVRTFYHLPLHEKLVRAVYPNSPSIYDLYSNISLVLLNSHISTYSAVPKVPNMVEIGGYFIDPPKELPKDLQKFLDEATDGVVYFSLGSNLKSKDLPEKRKKELINVLGRLKEKVIWKFEEELPDTPPNVLIRKWCPQQDILAHPNVKLFITHGGLLSTTEAIYHGVPILAIPVFGDQPANAARAVKDGYALQLAYHDPEFGEKKLEYLVNELLNNPRYWKNAQYRSKLYHDRPMSPTETAVYWVEYVVKHKGAPHLRVAGVSLPWYKYFMVDVVVFLLGILILVFYLLSIVFNILFKKKSKKEKTH